jgi:hypothetical protein
MRTMLLAVVLTVGVAALVGQNASAAPAVGAPIAKAADQSSSVTHVMEGCGRGWHRNRWGRCRPN